MKTLVLIESPAKCKKLESFLGSNYICRATCGHIYEIKDGLQGIGSDHQFTPQYTLIPQKRKYVDAIRSLLPSVDEVVLAGDPDREGEAICYHLCMSLRLPITTTKRIRFHEITQQAVQKAIQEPDHIHLNLVRAQQARQILDLYVGFTISPLLWKVISPKLSAGRCQSPILGLIDDRETLINRYDATTSSFGYYATLRLQDGYCLEKASLHPKLSSLEACHVFLSDIANPDVSYQIIDKTNTEHQEQAPLPFITSTIQSEANRAFRYSPKKTMLLLQSLYEKGRITYMRTDSTELSDEAKVSCRAIITSKWGVSYCEEMTTLSQKKKSKKVQHAQEAHEAIRPTDLAITSVTDDDENRLYQCIWKRTIASQMKPYRFLKMSFTIQAKEVYSLHYEESQTLFTGWKKVYDIADITVHPSLVTLDIPSSVTFEKGWVQQEFPQIPSRYHEGSLIMELEKKGIGRPSTYASLISKNMERGYIEKRNVEGIECPQLSFSFSHDNYTIQSSSRTIRIGKERQKLGLTPLGQQVLTFLRSHVQPLLDYGFTKTMEMELDHLVQDSSRYVPLLTQYVTIFSSLCQRIQIASSPFMLPSKQSLGKWNRKQVYLCKGRYGHYIQCGRLKVSVDTTVTLENAIVLLETKEQSMMKVGPFHIVQGPYGPYFRVSNTCYSVKHLDLAQITEDQCKEIMTQKKKNR